VDFGTDFGSLLLNIQIRCIAGFSERRNDIFKNTALLGWLLNRVTIKSFRAIREEEKVRSNERIYSLIIDARRQYLSQMTLQ